MMDEVMDKVRNVGERCAAAKVLRTSRVLTRGYDEALKPIGLTVTQFTLLNLIAHFKPESYAQIGKTLDIDRTTLSRNLALLHKAELVHLGPQGSDRKREVLLTARGIEKLEEAYPRWEAVQDRVEALFSDEEYVTLGKLLTRVRQIS